MSKEEFTKALPAIGAVVAVGLVAAIYFNGAGPSEPKFETVEECNRQHRSQTFVATSHVNTACVNLVRYGSRKGTPGYKASHCILKNAPAANTALEAGTIVERCRRENGLPPF